MGVDLGGNLAQKREDLGAQPRAKEATVVVGGVLGEPQLMARAVGEHVGAARVDERTEAISIAEREHSEPFQMRAVEEALKDRLGAIVAVVGGRDGDGAYGSGGRFQGGVAGVPGAPMKVAPGRDGDDRSRKRDCERL